MKTLLILVLAVGLLVAAVATRPDQANFEAYLNGQLQAGGGGGGLVKGSLRGLANDISARAYLQTTTVHNHYLWTTVEQDGRTQYIGAFSHWFKKSAAAKTT